MNEKFRNNLIDFLQLGKLKIMIPVALTGFTGYFLHDNHLTINTFYLSLGILFLAISASVLNQIQEIKQDRKMPRTRNRPLPSGRLSRKQAFLFFCLNFFAGTGLIFLTGGIPAVTIGLLTLFWYNVVYTYSKRITAFAVAPGALTGALPPLIGWVAAGGYPFDKTVIFMCFILFIGQVPHFWLIALKYGEEYSTAGFPSLTSHISRSAIGRLIFIWVVTAAIAGVFLTAFDVVRTRIIIIAIVSASVLLIWKFRGMAGLGEGVNGYRKYPLILNLYFLIVIFLLISDRIIY
jgi:protoheme IX farnesyltransferase